MCYERSASPLLFSLLVLEASMSVITASRHQRAQNMWVFTGGQLILGHRASASSS